MMFSISVITYLIYITLYCCLECVINCDLRWDWILHINNTLPIQMLHLSLYILLINWTQQGINRIKDSSDRFSSFKSSVEKAGGKLRLLYYGRIRRGNNYRSSKWWSSNVSNVQSWVSWKCENQNLESIYCWGRNEDYNMAYSVQII